MEEYPEENYNWDDLPEIGEANEGLDDIGETDVRVDTPKNGNKDISKKRIICCVVGIVVALVFVICFFLIALPTIQVNKANSALKAGDYALAVSLFEKSGKTSEGQKWYKPYKYSCGMEQFSNEKYFEAASYFAEADDYSDVKNQILNCGKELLKSGNYSDALEVFSLGDKSIAENEMNFAEGMILYQNKEYASAIAKLNCVENGNYDVEAVLSKVHYEYAMSLYNDGEYDNAKVQFVAAGDYEDAKTYAVGCEIMRAEEILEMYGTEAGIKAYSSLDSSVEFNGINVAERKKILNELNSSSDSKEIYQVIPKTSHTNESDSSNKSDSSVKKITFTNSEIEINIGDLICIEYTVSPENSGDDNVIWSSSDESVATVDEEGKVTGASEGTCTVSASFENSSADLTVTVVKGAPDLKAVYDKYNYDEYKDSITCLKVADDGSYLSMKFLNVNILGGNSYINVVNRSLGLPDYLAAEIVGTMPKYKYQDNRTMHTEEFEEITVTWYYNYGFFVIYKLNK